MTSSRTVDEKFRDAAVRLKPKTARKNRATTAPSRLEEVEPVRVVVDHDLLVAVQQLPRIRHAGERSDRRSV